MEKSICKIIYEKLEDNKIKKEKEVDFFVKQLIFQKKYALFANNHKLNENELKIGKIINVEFLKNLFTPKRK